MGIREEYLKFYKINFGQGRYCSKSWGLATYKAGQQSKQAEIDRIVSIITEAYKSGGNSSVEIVYDKIKELLK